tara:strand:- start:34 stop:273 length:240 start_codon:yes stop_codon:yes gene_type:complete
MEESTITIKLPNGYKVEFLPEDVYKKYDIFTVSITYILKGESVAISSDRRLKGGTYPKAQYNEIRERLKKASYGTERLL